MWSHPFQLSKEERGIRTEVFNTTKDSRTIRDGPQRFTDEVTRTLTRPTPVATLPILHRVVLPVIGEPAPTATLALPVITAAAG